MDWNGLTQLLDEDFNVYYCKTAIE